MAVQRGLGDDHEVLSQNAFCSGYVDSFGKWNNGFACPNLEEEDVFCCGTSTYRYCCTIDEQEKTGGTATSEDVEDNITADNLPLLLGVSLGALVTVIVVAIIACCLCRAFRKRGGVKPDRLQPPAAGAGVTNMYSYTASSLARRESARGGRHELEDMLQEVDEVAVMSRQSRVSGSATAISSLPRTFTSYRTPNRASFTDSVGNSSVSTTTDNERQLFIEQSVGMPPPYNFNKLSGGGFEDQLPYPPSFSTAGGDLGSGHYLAGMSPNDDSFYGANKL